VVDEAALRQAVTIEGLSEVVIAADLIDRAPLLIPTESLHSAMRKMVQSRHDELVVVDSEAEDHPVATLGRRDIIGAYDHRIQRTLEDQARADTGWRLPGLERFRGNGRKPKSPRP